MSAEQNPEPTTDTTPEKSNDSLTVDKVNELISNAIGNLFSSGKADVKEGAATKKEAAAKQSVSEEVKAELERLRASEQEESWKSGITSEVERLKGLAENMPVQEKRSKFGEWFWGKA